MKNRDLTLKMKKSLNLVMIAVATTVAITSCDEREKTVEKPDPMDAWEEALAEMESVVESEDWQAVTQEVENTFDIGDSSVIPNEIQPEPKIEYQAIFLNFSPKMSDNEFNAELKNSSELMNGKFILPVLTDNLGFNVSKKENRIILKYDGVKNRLRATLNETMSENLLSENEILISEFIDIFKSKYGEPRSVLPFKKNRKGEYFNVQEKSLNPHVIHHEKEIDGFLNKSLWNYGFQEKNYLVFQDSIKTVLIGYSKKGKIITNIYERELQKLNSETSNDNSNRTRTRMELFEAAVEKSRTHQEFGIALEINYLENSDFRVLLGLMEKDKYNFQNALNKLDSVERSKQNVIKQNKSKI